MAPLRNRSARTANDVDVLDGLPIRQWRQVDAYVGPPPDFRATPGRRVWPELPMPKESHLLPEVSQQLLRAARAGRFSRPASAPTPADADEAKQMEREREKAKAAAAQEAEAIRKDMLLKGFCAKKWAQLPRHLEEPEPEYLAKRRKGLPPARLHQSTLAGAAIPGPLAQTAAMRKTKVRRFDADGHAHIYEVLAPKDQRIEGEILPEDEAGRAPDAPPEPLATVVPGTVVEGVGVVNAEGLVVANDLLQQQVPTPPRRKPPPPRKKKMRGPGRGHKKVLFGVEAVGFPPGMGPSSSLSHVSAVSGGFGTPDYASSAVPSTTGDTPMQDANEVAESSDEEEEGEIVEEEEESDGRDDQGLAANTIERKQRDSLADDVDMGSGTKGLPPHRDALSPQLTGDARGLSDAPQFFDTSHTSPAPPIGNIQSLQGTLGSHANLTASMSYSLDMHRLSNADNEADTDSGADANYTPDTNYAMDAGYIMDTDPTTDIHHIPDAELAANTGYALDDHYIADANDGDVDADADYTPDVQYPAPDPEPAGSLPGLGFLHPSEDTPPATVEIPPPDVPLSFDLPNGTASPLNEAATDLRIEDPTAAPEVNHVNAMPEPAPPSLSADTLAQHAPESGTTPADQPQPQNPILTPPTLEAQPEAQPEAEREAAAPPAEPRDNPDSSSATSIAAPAAPAAPAQSHNPSPDAAASGDGDIFGSLERHLENATAAGPE